MAANNRRFEGVWIPANIWLSKELTLQEKVFLVEIKSLDNEHGCFASNDHFAEHFKLSKSRCSEVISSLKEKGVIFVQLIKKSGTNQIERRVIRVNINHEVFSERPIRKIEEGIREVEGGIRETRNTPSENTKGISTNNNNTTNNTRKKEEALSPISPLIDMNYMKIKQHFEQQVIYQQADFQQNKQLADLVDDYKDPKLIIEAMNIAVERGVPKIPYINGILKGWRADGITNHKQLTQNGGKQNAKNGQPVSTYDGKTPEEIQLMERLRTYSS